jgi:hypothetical protein
MRYLDEKRAAAQGALAFYFLLFPSTPATSKKYRAYF